MKHMSISYKHFYIILFIYAITALCGCAKAQAKESSAPQHKNGGSSMVNAGNIKEIYLAGGCFWGVEGYFSRITGVLDTDTGYANGKTDKTTYQNLHSSDHAETVKIRYNSGVIGLDELLEHYFRIIDPLSVNQQGNDKGRQYRTGIYYTDKADKPVIDAFMQRMQTQYSRPIAVETEPLRHFIRAEEYHQDYLQKIPPAIAILTCTLPMFRSMTKKNSLFRMQNRLKKRSIRCSTVLRKRKRLSVPLPANMINLKGKASTLIS